MVGCDNEDCRFEWFHLECVGLAAPVRAVIIHWLHGMWVHGMVGRRPLLSDLSFPDTSKLAPLHSRRKAPSGSAPSAPRRRRRPRPRLQRRRRRYQEQQEQQQQLGRRRRRRAMGRWRLRRQPRRHCRLWVMVLLLRRKGQGQGQGKGPRRWPWRRRSRNRMVSRVVTDRQQRSQTTDSEGVMHVTYVVLGR